MKKGHDNRVAKILDYIRFIKTSDESLADDPTNWNMKGFRKWKFEDDKPKSPVIQPTTGTGMILLARTSTTITTTSTTSMMNMDIASNKEVIVGIPIRIAVISAMSGFITDIN